MANKNVQVGVTLTMSLDEARQFHAVVEKSGTKMASFVMGLVRKALQEEPAATPPPTPKPIAPKEVEI